MENGSTMSNPKPGDLVQTDGRGIAWWKGIPAGLDLQQAPLPELWYAAEFMTNADLEPVVFLRQLHGLTLALHPHHGLVISSYSGVWTLVMP